MNEQSQLDAIKAELVADGYEVEQDVSAQQLVSDGAGAPSMGDLVLDLVAKLDGKAQARDDRTRLLIIEIANRTRRLGGQRFAPRIAPEDEEAVTRFQKIAAAIADKADIGFQIRFFDVSADQAAARRLKTTKVKSKSGDLPALASAHHALLASSKGQPALYQSMVIAHLWSRWLRIAGHLYPGRGHREFKAADLRTIQKELYDQKILLTDPSSYRRTHVDVLALIEGGDVDYDRVVQLEADTRRLIEWAMAYFNVPATVGDTRPEAEMSFEELERAISTEAPASVREKLRADMAILALQQGSDAFPGAVARFLRGVWNQGIVPDVVIRALLSKIRD